MPHRSDQPQERHWSPYFGSEYGMENERIVPPARARAPGTGEADGTVSAAEPRRPRRGAGGGR